MSLEFLSDEWFAKVKEIRDSAGDVEAPAALADLVINITVKTDDGEKHMAMAGGMIEEGHHDDAGGAGVRVRQDGVNLTLH